MTEADAEDIRRVLAICFRGESELDAMDIERILSLDMGWLKPDEAATSVQGTHRIRMVDWWPRESLTS